MTKELLQEIGLKSREAIFIGDVDKNIEYLSREDLQQIDVRSYDELLRTLENIIKVLN